MFDLTLIKDLGEQAEVHVYPQFGKEHVLDNGIECWCHPDRDVMCPWVIVHNVEQ